MRGVVATSSCSTIATKKISISFLNLGTSNTTQLLKLLWFLVNATGSITITNADFIHGDLTVVVSMNATRLNQ